MLIKKLGDICERRWDKLRVYDPPEVEKHEFFKASKKSSYCRETGEEDNGQPLDQTRFLSQSSTFTTGQQETYALKNKNRLG
jgi:hypothetical protein